MVTTEDDDETLELCHLHDVTPIISKNVTPFSVGFHAAFNKSGCINEALDFIIGDAWILILDADILLPRAFRHIFECGSYDKNKLYGVEGRRICRNLNHFQALADNEPWFNDLARNIEVIGYFNLFHSSQPNNRYPPSDIRRRWHDDWQFWCLFNDIGSETLPISVLHLGAPAKHWGGVESVGLLAQETSTTEPDLSPQALLLLPDLIQSTCLIGTGDNPGAFEVLKRSQSVLLVDLASCFCTSAETFSTLEPNIQLSNFAYANKIIAKTIGGASPIFWRKEKIASIIQANLAAQFEFSVSIQGDFDYVFVNCDPGAIFYLTHLPQILDAMSLLGVVSGVYLGQPSGGDFLRHLSILLGVTPTVFQDGSWILHNSDVQRPLFSPLKAFAICSQEDCPVEALNGQMGCNTIVYCRGKKDAEIIINFLAEFSLARVLVIQEGSDFTPLIVACTLVEATYLSVFEEMVVRYAGRHVALANLGTEAAVRAIAEQLGLSAARCYTAASLPDGLDHRITAWMLRIPIRIPENSVIVVASSSQDLERCLAVWRRVKSTTSHRVFMATRQTIPLEEMLCESNVPQDTWTLAEAEETAKVALRKLASGGEVVEHLILLTSRHLPQPGAILDLSYFDGEPDIVLAESRRMQGAGRHVALEDRLASLSCIEPSLFPFAILGRRALSKLQKDHSMYPDNIVSETGLNRMTMKPETIGFSSYI